MRDELFPAGHTSDWRPVAPQRVGWSCLIIDGIAVLEAIYEPQYEVRLVVVSDYYDLHGRRKTITRTETRPI